MPYFKVSINSTAYNDEWVALVKYIKSHSSWNEYRAHLGQLTYPLEAKALQIFTIGSRLTNAVSELAESHKNNWTEIFVETLILLYPMLELIGSSRLGRGLQHNESLFAGIEWLRDINVVPVSQKQKQILSSHITIDSLPSRPTVRDLFCIRQYFLHGIKSPSDTKDLPNSEMADIMNYHLPKEIVPLARTRMHEYWEQLKDDDGSGHWINALSQANIYPCMIKGSELYDYGLIDPDITYRLSDWKENQEKR